MSDVELTPYLLLASIRKDERTIDQIAQAIMSLRQAHPEVPFVLPWNLGFQDVLEVLESRGWVRVTRSNGTSARYCSSKNGIAVLGRVAPRLRADLGVDIATL